MDLGCGAEEGESSEVYYSVCEVVEYSAIDQSVYTRQEPNALPQRRVPPDIGCLGVEWGGGGSVRGDEFGGVVEVVGVWCEGFDFVVD